MTGVPHQALKIWAKKRLRANVTLNFMERVMGIEPTLSAWEAEVLPLNYTRWTMLPALCARLTQAFTARILPVDHAPDKFA